MMLQQPFINENGANSNSVTERWGFRTPLREGFFL